MRYGSSSGYPSIAGTTPKSTTLRCTACSRGSSRDCGLVRHGLIVQRYGDIVELPFNREMPRAIDGDGKELSTIVELSESEVVTGVGRVDTERADILCIERDGQCANRPERYRVVIHVCDGWI